MSDEPLQQAEDGVDQSSGPGNFISKNKDIFETPPLTTQNNASVISASEIAQVDTSRPSETIIEENKAVDVHPDPSELVDNGDQTAEEWIDILGNKQIMKKVIRSGKGVSTRPTPQSRARVSIKGWLDSGDVVEKQRTTTLTVGDGDVIQALDLAVTLMETGEIAEVKTTPRFAYGSAGREPEIPPNANLTYELELLEVLGPIDYCTISLEDLLVAVDKKRVKGNEVFQRHEYDKAVMCYQRGLKMLKTYLEERGEPENQAIRDMQIRCWNNVAAAQLKGELYTEVLESCLRVLERDPDNVKALFRSGKVLSQQWEMAEAITRLQRAYELKPDEKAIKQELQRAVQRKAEVKEKEKAMFQRMVNGEATHSSAATKKNTPPREDSNWMQGPLPYFAAAIVVATLGIGLAYFITQRY